MKLGVKKPQKKKKKKRERARKRGEKRILTKLKQNAVIRIS